MLKKRYLFLIILVCLFAISAVSANEISNETNMVANDYDSSISESVNENTLSASLSEEEVQGSPDNGTFAALQEKINDAPEYSIINLENNYTYDSGFSTDGIIINKTLTINGNGYVIDALGQSRIFYINSPTITLNNITFKNGYVTSDHGGAIYFTGNVSNSSISGEFINNTASVGGAIFFTTVSNSSISGEFINNTACLGGAVFFDVDVSNSSVFGIYVGNTAKNDAGGAIYFQSSVSNSSVSGEFINNTAGVGGAICFYYCVSNSSVSGEFINNTAKKSVGGAIFFGESVYNSNILGNFIGNTAASSMYTGWSSGGAICFYGIVFNSNILGNFIGNTASSEGSSWSGGGAINFRNSVSNSSIFADFLNNTVSSKGSADSNGGAIYFDSISNFSICGDFINNTAGSGGGAIFSSNRDASNIKIINSIFNNNGAVIGGAIQYLGSNSLINNSTFYSNIAEEGGVLFIGGNNNTIENLILINNSAKYAGSIEIIGTNTNIINSLFECNNASVAGGAIQVIGTDNIIENSTFNNNIAPYGSAIQWFGENGLVNNSIFINNKGTDTGTIHIISDNITVSKSILINNSDPYDVYSTVYSTVANNNWFGNILDNQVISPKVSSEVIIDNWHYLDVDTDSETIKIDESAIINIDLNRLSNNGGDIGYKNELQDIILNISSVNGVCNVSTVKLKDGKAKITFTPENAGYGSVTVNYLTVSQTIDFIIKDSRIEPNMTFNVENSHVGETVEIDTFLPSDATGDVVVTINNKTYSAKIKNGEAKVLIKDLPINKYDFIMDYSGDNKYSFEHVNGSFLVSKISDYNITAENLTIYGDQSAEIVVNVPSDATGNIVLYILSEEHILPVIDGKATVVISDLSGHSMCGFIAILMDDPKYELKSVYGTITILPKVSNYTISSPNVDVYCGETGNITVYLPQDATGGLKVLCDGLDIGYVYINEGIATFESTYQISSIHTFDFYYEGNYKYTEKSTSAILTVHKISDYSFNTTDVYITAGETANIIANLPKDATGTANIRVFNENFEYTTSTTVNEGQITFNVDGLLKDAEFIINYLGDYKYESKVVSGSVFVKSIIVINAPDVTKYYGGPERFIVTVNKDNKPLINEEVKFYLNGRTYTRTTDENGIASIGLNLLGGVYNVTATVDNQEVNAVVTVLSTVNGTDVVKMFRNGTQYYATFLDSEGKYLADGTTVNFNINGVFYERRVSGDKGLARLNINLPQGEYIITAMNPVTGEKAANNITVLSSIVENYDLTKYYKNASKYTLRVIGDNGRPVGEGVKVKLNINGVFYTRTTNSSGYINMNINLPPGTYTVTAEYNGLMASNEITVLSVLETHDLVMNYQDGSKFEAKVLDGQGRPYAGQDVTFNINGVFYPKITDENGIARLAINLPAGEYIITSTYNGLNAANKVTISG